MRQRTHRPGAVGPMTEALSNLGRRIGQRFVAPDAWKILAANVDDRSGQSEDASSQKRKIDEELVEDENQGCECPKFLVSFSPKFFQPECLELMREAHSPDWEGILVTIEDIVGDSQGDNIGITMYVKKTARILYGKLLEVGMGGKGSWKKFSPIITSIEYPPATTLADVVGAVRPLMRKLHFQEEKILRFQRRRDVLKATPQQRLQ